MSSEKKTTLEDVVSRVDDIEKITLIPAGVAIEYDEGLQKQAGLEQGRLSVPCAVVSFVGGNCESLHGSEASQLVKHPAVQGCRIPVFELDFDGHEP